MKKIALIAYAVSDKYGSEYAVGWEFISHMAQTGDCEFIVYYGSCKSNTMGNLEPLPHINNVIWKCIELPNDLRNCFYWFIRKRIYYVFGFYFQFKEWHKIVAKQISEDNKIEKFDIIHYLNPIGIKEPGESWKLNVPYVWGPVQGVEDWPRCLYGILGIKGRLEAYARRFIQNLNLRYSLWIRKSIARADVIVGATPNTCKQLNILFKKRSFYLPENGLKETDKGDVRRYMSGTPLQLIWVGELSNRKGLILLLMALKEIKDNKDKVCLSVYGDGLQRDTLQKYVDHNDLSKIVTFYGRVERTAVHKAFMKSHLHIITSLSEATTTVIWEAKACGVPTMTLDHCGMAGVVDNDNGIKIPIISLSQIITDIAANLMRIIKIPSIIEKLSTGVLESNIRYSWEERCKIFNRIYEEAIAKYNNNL